MLLRDIMQNKDDRITAAAGVIAHIDPDILLLTNIDYDHQQAALGAFAGVIESKGTDFEHQFTRKPNTGLATGLDLDQNGYLSDARDAQGYGPFSGYAGMAILSKFPIDTSGVRDFSDMLWMDFPDRTLPMQDGTLFPSAAVYDVQRLSSTAHWDVPVQSLLGQINILAFYATPPVFDGPEDRNGLRNADEIRFWSLYLGGALDAQPPDDFAILASANLDPVDGDGRSDAMIDLLAHPLIYDPQPRSAGAAANADVDHAGDPASDTVDWDSPPGNLRVDYVLPSVSWTVIDSGVYWPNTNALLGSDGNAAGRHRLVWVDIAR